MTIAQQLNVTTFPFIINDKNDKNIYYEASDGYWEKTEYDARGKEIRYEDFNGYWRKREYDDNGKEIRYETSSGYWSKCEYDDNGNEIYSETSNGFIVDKRPKTVELTLQQIADKLGINLEQLRIKD